MRKIYTTLLLLLLALASAPTGRCDEPITYEVSATALAGWGDFAPLYTSALTHGTISQTDGLLLGARIYQKADRSARLSYGYGATAYAAATSASTYQRYTPGADGTEGEWTGRRQRPASLWLQELYGELKYRSLFLTAGMKEQHSPLLNESLTSGDLIESGNTRPLPGLRAGFIDFQDIPLTRGWVQIEGQLFYGRYTDSDWWAEHYNRYNGHISRGQWQVYRRCNFRTKPSERLSVTVGVQCASQFGGTTDYYYKGAITRTEAHPAHFKDFVKMFWPGEGGGEGFYEGNTLGSWNLKARYRLRDLSEVKFYFQWPWEDGSGMGKLNGFDGLWGVEYDFSHKSSLVRAVAVEFLDLTNQSGPMHWDPDDAPGTDLSYRAEGADDYYNNAFYNPYAVYGLAQGSPMVMSPLYNLDGYMQFVGNRMRGIHVAVEGSVGPNIDCRIKLGHRRAWGNGQIQLPQPIRATSMLLEAAYRMPSVPGLALKAQFALDNGTMPSNNAGFMVSATYRGFIGKKK